MKTITCDRCGEIVDNADAENRIVFNHKIQKFLEHMGKDYCVECKKIVVEKIADILDENDVDRSTALPPRCYCHCPGDCPFRGTFR